MLRSYRTPRTLTLPLLAIAFVAFASCGPTETTCDDGIGCVANGNAGNGGSSTDAGAETGGSSSGKGGMSTAGKGGETSGGSSHVGGAGTGGEGGNEAGAGGTPIVLPCDGACTGNKPVCKESTDMCVECLMPSDCTSGVKTKCDAAANACVQCLAPTDCSDAKTAKCDKGSCIKCTTNDDCAHLAGKTVCDTAAGECVQCTGKDASACGESMGTALVCDSLKRTCSNQKEHSAGLCQVCLSDQQCNSGQLCVKETFGDPAQDVGYFCFETQAAATGADCTLIANQPYTKTLTKQSSVDGVSADICGLSTSSCTARNQFGSKDCATSMAADDTKCGFAAGKDSKCVPFGASQFRCTMTCGFDEDCPGKPCDKGVNPAVCKLQ